MDRDEDLPMDSSPAFARLEQAILLLVVLGVAGIALTVFTDQGAENPVGLIPGSLMDSSAVILVDTPLEGYGVPAEDQIGSVALSLRLFPGSLGAVDMDRVCVLFTVQGGREETCDTGSVQPNWTIADRLHALPVGTVDDDNLLEPGEEFVLKVWPSRTLTPGETFTIAVAPLHGPGVTVTRTVPARVTPVTDLG